MTKKKSIFDPFEEYGDIGKNPDGTYVRTYRRTSVNTIYENGLKTDEKTQPILPVLPYESSIITKKGTSLGRGKRTYSVSNELVMRLKLLVARINQDRMQTGKKRVCAESDLIEEGIRYVLKKNRYKYKDLDTPKDD